MKSLTLTCGISHRDTGECVRACVRVHVPRVVITPLHRDWSPEVCPGSHSFLPPSGLQFSPLFSIINPISTWLLGISAWISHRHLRRNMKNWNFALSYQTCSFFRISYPHKRCHHQCNCSSLKLNS